MKDLILKKKTKFIHESVFLKANITDGKTGIDDKMRRIYRKWAKRIVEVREKASELWEVRILERMEERDNNDQIRRLIINAIVRKYKILRRKRKK